MVSKKNQKFQKVDLATFLASAPGDESAQAPSDEPKLRANKGHGGIGKIGSIQTTVSASGLKVAGYEVREHRQYAQGAKADKDDLAESMKRLRIVKPAREWKISTLPAIPFISQSHLVVLILTHT